MKEYYYATVFKNGDKKILKNFQHVDFSKIRDYREFDSISDCENWLNECSYEKVKLRPCKICEKPINHKGICDECKKKIEYLKKKNHSKFTVKAIVWLQYYYLKKRKNVFTELNKNPRLINTYYKNSESFKTKAADKILNNDYKFHRQRKFELEIPIESAPVYIKNLNNDRDDIRIITVKGKIESPLLEFECLRCGKTFKNTYQALKISNGHKCEDSLSKGEFSITKFLQDNNITFKTQFDTLKCINPETNHQLPYDFEIPSLKTIIEVQGEQHYKFIPLFHGDESGFEYQQYKDKLKKDYATSKGYNYIELTYDQIENNEYKNILERELIQK